jgi:chitosanase
VGAGRVGDELVSRLLLARRGTLAHTKPVVVGVAVDTLADDFDAGILDPQLWASISGPYELAGGALELTAATSGFYSQLKSASQYKLAGSSVFVQMSPPSVEESTAAYSLLSLYGGAAPDTWVRAYVESSSGVVGWTCQVAGAVQFTQNFTPTSGNEWLLVDPFLRIEEDAGALVFSASQDGVNWAELDTRSTPSAVASIEDFNVNLEAYRSAGSSSAGDPAVFDNLNVPGESSVLSAGADATVSAGSTFTRTATEPSGATITARAWTIQSGPLGAGTTIGTAASLSWTPGSSPAGTTDIRQPVFQEMAFEFTSTAENSTTDWTTAYNYCQDIKDGRGYTGGIVGFTSATGDMLELVQNYVAAKPSGNVLAPYLDGLEACAEYGDTVDDAVYGEDGGGASDIAASELGSGFLSAWTNAANNDPIFRRCQREYRADAYWGPALAAAIADGLGGLGLLIYYDTIVNHGPGEPDTTLDPDDNGSFDNIRAATKAHNSTSNQKSYLTAFKNNRSTVLSAWGDNPSDGRIAAITSLLAPTSPDLNLLGTNVGGVTAVRWSMYGDDFSFNRPNPPTDSQLGTYVLRYTATGAVPSYDELTITVT